MKSPRSLLAPSKLTSIGRPEMAWLQCFVFLPTDRRRSLVGYPHRLLEVGCTCGNTPIHCLRWSWI